MGGIHRSQHVPSELLHLLLESKSQCHNGIRHSCGAPTFSLVKPSLVWMLGESIQAGKSQAGQEESFDGYQKWDIQIKRQVQPFHTILHYYLTLEYTFVLLLTQNIRQYKCTVCLFSSAPWGARLGGILANRDKLFSKKIAIFNVTVACFHFS